ncbi:MAG: gas vesicle protein [Chloroflexi bacterium]|nr:gas vesicle protein [Chloroflexota bacterium]
MAVKPQKNTEGTLADAIDRILDKGLVINADIAVSLAGVELLGIKIRAAMASFETAAKYGLAFPTGTMMETPAWQEALVTRESCPQCDKRVQMEDLLSDGCPWCGWISAKAKRAGELNSGNGHRPVEIPNAASV